MKFHSSSILKMAGAAAGLLLAAGAAPAAELVVDGMFVTTPAIPTATGYSSDVGRSGTTAAYILNGTTGTAGWQTTEADARFEVWTPGYLGSPASVGNTLELANTAKGTTVYQDVTTATGSVNGASFSFGYAARDGNNQDKFTVTVTDLTSTATLLSQQINPNAPFSTNTLFAIGLAITPGDTYRIAFLDQNTFSNGTQSAHIDQVSFNQQVPEPATWLGAGLLLGVAGLAARRRFALAAL